MQCYVFRITYEGNYGVISQELREGRLRQGWGAAGMGVGEDSTLASFTAAWLKRWPGEEDMAPRIRRKYKNLQIMPEIQPGDLLVIPKVSMTQAEGWREFTLARCTAPYTFAPLEEQDDYGHIIGIEPILSCPYGNPLAFPVVKGFRSYQSAVNRVWSEAFTDAVERILLEHERDPAKSFREEASSLTALGDATALAREVYLGELVKKINSWSPRQLERVIEELFARNGYLKLAANHYDGKGGDIDLQFTCYASDTLLGDIAAMRGDVPLPEIRVQAKNKSGQDLSDVWGVRQLTGMKGSREAVNILINTTPEFTQAAREEASGDVILINGQKFASLLVKYGLDVLDLS